MFTAIKWSSSTGPPHSQHAFVRTRQSDASLHAVDGCSFRSTTTQLPPRQVASRVGSWGMKQPGQSTSMHLSAAYFWAPALFKAIESSRVAAPQEPQQLAERRTQSDGLSQIRQPMGAPPSPALLPLPAAAELPPLPEVAAVPPPPAIPPPPSLVLLPPQLANTSSAKHPPRAGFKSMSPTVAWRAMRSWCDGSADDLDAGSAGAGYTDCCDCRRPR